MNQKQKKQIAIEALREYWALSTTVHLQIIRRRWDSNGNEVLTIEVLLHDGTDMHNISNLVGVVLGARVTRQKHGSHTMHTRLRVVDIEQALDKATKNIIVLRTVKEGYGYKGTTF